MSVSRQRQTRVRLVKFRINLRRFYFKYFKVYDVLHKRNVFYHIIVPNVYMIPVIAQITKIALGRSIQVRRNEIEAYVLRDCQCIVVNVGYPKTKTTRVVRTVLSTPTVTPCKKKHKNCSFGTRISK